MRSLLSSAVLFSLALAGCYSGPDRGWIGESRGRARLISEQEEKPLLDENDPPERFGLFPLLFLERDGGRRGVELLWPILEYGVFERGSTFFHLRPFYGRGVYRDSEERVIFPFWWHSRERREIGGRSVDHLWPLYGIHRREIDLAPAVEHHVLFPLLCFTRGPERWKARAWPLFALSNGYVDRGWWIFPLFKAGTGRGGWAGRNRFLYLLDPLIAYERFSTAGDRPVEGPEETRTEIKILGGLLGWERADGRGRWRFLWMRFG